MNAPRLECSKLLERVYCSWRPPTTDTRRRFISIKASRFTLPITVAHSRLFRLGRWQSKHWNFLRLRPRLCYQVRCSCSLFVNYPLEYSRDWTVTGSGNYSHLQKRLWLFDLSSKWNSASIWLHGALLRNSSISNLEPVSCSGADSPNPKSNASLYRWFCVLPVLGLDLYFACVNSHALKYSTWNTEDEAWFYSEQQDLELTAENRK